METKHKFGCRKSIEGFSVLALCVWITGATSGHASDACLLPGQTVSPLKRFDVPTTVAGLDPDILSPSEGKLQFFFESDPRYGPEAWSPTGDFSLGVGPYDPVEDVLYVYGYFENGWIEAIEERGFWRFGESGVFSPHLNDPPRDRSDSVNGIVRSPMLGVQFYQGTEQKHWLTRQRYYRVYQVSGSELMRVPELEEGKLRYLGDDPNSGMAVFIPHGAPRTEWSSTAVWYDGNSIVKPKPGQVIPVETCKDEM